MKGLLVKWSQYKIPSKPNNDSIAVIKKPA